MDKVLYGLGPSSLQPLAHTLPYCLPLPDSPLSPSNIPSPPTTSLCTCLLCPEIPSLSFLPLFTLGHLQYLVPSPGQSLLVVLLSPQTRSLIPSWAFLSPCTFPQGPRRPCHYLLTCGLINVGHSHFSYTTEPFIYNTFHIQQDLGLSLSLSQYQAEAECGSVPVAQMNEFSAIWTKHRLGHLFPSSLLLLLFSLSFSLSLYMPNSVHSPCPPLSFPPLHYSSLFASCASFLPSGVLTALPKFLSPKLLQLQRHLESISEMDQPLSS